MHACMHACTCLTNRPWCRHMTGHVHGFAPVSGRQACKAVVPRLLAAGCAPGREGRVQPAAGDGRRRPAAKVSGPCACMHANVSAPACMALRLGLHCYHKASPSYRHSAYGHLHAPNSAPPTAAATTAALGLQPPGHGAAAAGLWHRVRFKEHARGGRTHAVVGLGLRGVWCLRWDACSTCADFDGKASVVC